MRSRGGNVMLISTKLAQRPIGPLIRALIGGAQPFFWLMGPRRAAL